MIQSRLPKEVELVPGSVYCRHDSRLAIRQLAGQLRETPEPSVPVIAALIMDKGVMRTQWYYHLFAWIAEKRGMKRFDYWYEVFRRFPKLAEQLIQGTANRAINGKDREQAGSVGGFSQRELNFLSNCVAVSTGAMSAELERTAERNAVN